ncbi:hypothetical protein EYF80_021510 [Liparis tanakae]|uniref:Uncharacterized protein n=1 Tax=Liparis tanakae TaxID=230148 RepID=A0A4Z2HRK7_9TELE|nr:hypothetical protein EYF80_021510 [Liparis tanakae]
MPPLAPVLDGISAAPIVPYRRSPPASEAPLSSDSRLISTASEASLSLLGNSPTMMPKALAQMLNFCSVASSSVLAKRVHKIQMNPDFFDSSTALAAEQSKSVYNRSALTFLTSGAAKQTMQMCLQRGGAIYQVRIDAAGRRPIDEAHVLVSRTRPGPRGL